MLRLQQLRAQQQTRHGVDKENMPGISTNTPVKSILGGNAINETPATKGAVRKTTATGPRTIQNSKQQLNDHNQPKTASKNFKSSKEASFPSTAFKPLGSHKATPRNELTVKRPSVLSLKTPAVFNTSRNTIATAKKVEVWEDSDDDDGQSPNDNGDKSTKETRSSLQSSVLPGMDVDKAKADSDRESDHEIEYMPPRVECDDEYKPDFVLDYTRLLTPLSEYKLPRDLTRRMHSEPLDQPIDFEPEAYELRDLVGDKDESDALSDDFFDYHSDSVEGLIF